jgi:hypothetical protein
MNLYSEKNKYNRAIKIFSCSVVYLGILFTGVGVQQIQLRTQGRENRDLGMIAASSGVTLNLQMTETLIFIRLLWMYFPRNWEFSSALSKLFMLVPHQQFENKECL